MQKEQIIYGVPPSKSNSYRIITIHGHSSLKKTKAMQEYEKNFFLQCGAYRNRQIKNFFEFYIDVYLPNQRQDLDNILKGVLDALQTCKAIANDRYCVKIVAEKFIDPVRPRVEFTIKEVKGIEARPTNQPTLFDGEEDC